MADKKCFLDKDYTRRQFLKLSGKSLAGLALSTSMLSAMGVTEKAVAEDKVRVWAFPQGLLVVNASVAQSASNSGCRPNCRCPAQSETSAAYDILSAFASQQPHHAQQDWRLFPIQARQQQNQEDHPLKHHPHWTWIQAVKNGHAMCAPFVQYTGTVFACPLFSFLGAIRLNFPPLFCRFISHR